MKKIYLWFFLFWICCLTTYTNANFLDSIWLNKKDDKVKLDFTLSNYQSEEESIKNWKSALNWAWTNSNTRWFMTEEEAIRKRFYELQTEEAKKKALEEWKKLLQKWKQYYEKYEKTTDEYKNKVLDAILWWKKENNNQKQITNITNKKQTTTKWKKKTTWIKNELKKMLKTEEMKIDELCNKHTKDIAQFSTWYSYINDNEFENIIWSLVKIEETYKDEPEKIWNMYAETYLNFFELWNKYALWKTDCEKFAWERYNQVLDIIAINSTNYHNYVWKTLREKWEMWKRNVYAYSIFKDHKDVINSWWIDNIWTWWNNVLIIKKDKNTVLNEFKNKEMNSNYLNKVIYKYNKLKNMNLNLTSKK